VGLEPLRPGHPRVLQIRRRYRRALAVLPDCEDEQRIALLGAVIAPTDPRLEKLLSKRTRGPFRSRRKPPTLRRRADGE
jgi:hypothetical protein